MVLGMSDQSVTDPDAMTEPAQAQATIVYQGPVAPHWEITSEFGDPHLINSFRGRVNARLMLLPPHDPQFRRNKERVNRRRGEGTDPTRLGSRGRRASQPLIKPTAD